MDLRVCLISCSAAAQVCAPSFGEPVGAAAAALLAGRQPFVLEPLERGVDRAGREVSHACQPLLSR
ncbi:hypothetical protein [Nonomuraea dietziae]|uniref:hypothetical protein n=1 Tax=Nonomuraea dietziae TaxID=65515 RepID=UPI0033CC1E2A